MGMVACILWLVVLSSPTATEEVREAYAQAKRLQDCPGLHVRFPGELVTYECYWRRGVKEQRLEEAARMLQDVVRDRPDTYAAWLYLANVRVDQYHKHGAARKELLDEALRCCHRALAGFETVGNQEGLFWTYMAFARLDYIQGKPEKIERTLANARRAAEASGDRKLVADVQLQQAWHFYRRSSYSRAWALFKQLERDIPDGMRADFHTSVLDGLGATTWAQGRYDEAFGYYRKQLEEVVPRRLPGWEADIRRNLALLASKVRMPRKFSRAEVIGFHQEALDAAVRAGDPRREAKARLLLIEAQGPDLDPARKLAQLEELLKLFRKRQEPRYIYRVLQLVAPARLEALPGQARAAFELIDEAIAITRRLDKPEEVARGWLVRAQMRWMAGPRERARTESRTALRAVESIRGRQRDRELQARILGRFAFAYRRLSGYLLDPARGRVTDGDIDLAFRFAERMRARVLLEAVESDDDGAKGCPELAKSRAGIAAVQKRLVDPELTTEDRGRALAELEELEVKETVLREGPCAAEQSPVVPQVAGVPDVQAALGEDQALLAFQVERGPDPEMPKPAGRTGSWAGSWLVVITRGGARAVRIPDRDELDPAVQLFLGLVERRDGSEAAAADKLYTWLLREGLAGLDPGVRRLVIVPDGPLFHVPFGVLRPGKERTPLAAAYQIAVVPSASLWLRWQAAGRRKHRLPVLALADPALPDATREAATRGAGIFSTGLRLGRLPRARDEARAVAGHLGGARLFEGSEATERLLKTEPLGDYAMLHLAAHAVVDESHPHRSAVVLAAGADGEDGLLQPPEIAALDLDGVVVILSACSSARGEILEGEGAMSLARSFFQAGARAVLGNLWPLRDDEAAALVDDFSAHLAEGLSLGAALEATQSDWIRAGKPAAAWAGLLLQGDADLVPFPGGRPGNAPGRTLFAFAAGALLAGVLSWTIRRARARKRGRTPV